MVPACPLLHLVAVPKNTILILRVYVHALPILSPQSSQNRSPITLIVAPKHRLDSFRSFTRVVMRHGRKQVMRNMRIRDMMKHMVKNSIVSVHRCQSTSKPIPFRAVIMRQSSVRMLQKT